MVTTENEKLCYYLYLLFVKFYTSCATISHIHVLRSLVGVVSSELCKKLIQVVGVVNGNE